MFAGPHPGRAGPTRFAGPTGAGYDAKGNLYVSCNVPRGGTVLRAFALDKTMTWEALGLEFVDVADAVPGTQRERRLHGRRSLLTTTLGAPAGKNWKWVAHTLDPFRSPDDLPPPLPRPPVRHERPRCWGARRSSASEACGRESWASIAWTAISRSPSVVLSSGPIEGGQDRVDAPAPAASPADGSGATPTATAGSTPANYVRDRGAGRRILGEQRRPRRRPLAGRARHRYLAVEVPRAR